MTLQFLQLTTPDIKQYQTFSLNEKLLLVQAEIVEKWGEIIGIYKKILHFPSSYNLIELKNKISDLILISINETYSGGIKEEQEHKIFLDLHILYAYYVNSNKKYADEDINVNFNFLKRLLTFDILSLKTKNLLRLLFVMCIFFNIDPFKLLSKYGF